MKPATHQGFSIKVKQFMEIKISALTLEKSLTILNKEKKMSALGEKKKNIPGAESAQLCIKGFKGRVYFLLLLLFLSPSKASAPSPC